MLAPPPVGPIRPDRPDAGLPPEIAASMAGHCPFVAGRALAAIGALAAARLACPDQTATWTGSDLTGDGFPFERAFTTADGALRWVFDPGSPGLSAAARRARALTALSELGHPLGAAAALACTGPASGFGAWIAGRHDAQGDRYKLYLALDDGPDADRILDALHLPRPRLAGKPAVTRMLGLGPGPAREVYYRTEATRFCLPRLLEPAGRADAAGEIADLIQTAWGHRIRDRLPGGSVGVSYAVKSDRTPPVVTLHVFARALWGGDARIRERMLKHLPAPGPYATASAPIATRHSAQTRHGMIGITPAPDIVHWSIGLRPVTGPC